MNTEIVGVVMFCLGGFVSAVLFYPKTKKEEMKEIDTEYLARMLSFQYWAGVRDGQTDGRLPKVDAEDVGKFAHELGSVFNGAATTISKRIYKDEGT